MEKDSKESNGSDEDHNAVIFDLHPDSEKSGSSLSSIRIVERNENYFSARRTASILLVGSNQVRKEHYYT